LRTRPCFGAYLAGVDQPFAVVYAGEKGADPDALSLWIGVAADHDLLPLDALDLEPVAASPAGRLALLRDDSLESQPAGFLEELRAAADHVIAVA
jgi:hypothetical protein